jgi:hypothetical protein
MDGANNDQNDAAIMTPAAKPLMTSRTFRLTDLKKNTNEAPMMVHPQVNKPAMNACMIGFN